MNTINVVIQHVSNLLTWLVFVAPWEQALRVRLGKNVVLLSAGYHLRIPFFARVYRHSIRLRRFIIRPQVLTTSDGRTIALSGSVGFRVDDLKLLFSTLHDALDTIEASIASLVAMYVSSNPLSDCVPAEIEKFVESQMSLELYGLADGSYRVTNYAVVKTYRLINGDFASWSNGNALNTNDHEKAGA